MSQHNIVIIGGSYAGLGVAHKLLKTVIPSLDPKTPYKVTLISGSTHFFWTVGAPRAMLSPYPHDLSDSFIPIADGFTQYSEDSFEFVHGQVTALNTNERTLSVKLSSEIEQGSGGAMTQSFDSLVLAAGGRGPSPLYSIHGSHVLTLEAFRDLHARVPVATTILVVGGGSAGTETAGELGSTYGKTKNITLLSGTDRLLKNLRPAIGARAEGYLRKMGVKVVHNIRVESSKDGGDNGTLVQLSNGETMTVDILITATGRAPASSFLPEFLLDSRKAVVVDDFLRVPAAGPRVYALGDIASTSKGGAVDIKYMMPVAIANITFDLSDGRTGETHEQRYLPSTKETQLVPVGRSKGVGAVFGWWTPSFFVWLIKGRTFMFPNALKTVLGTV